MKSLACLLGLIVFLASPTASHGRVLEESNVMGWLVGAYSDNRTGQFTHCATSVPYRNGTTLFFHLASNFAWSLSLHNPQWRLSPGQTLNLAYSIDRGPRIPVLAKVNTLGMVGIPLADSKALFRAFQRGHRLHVHASRETFTFLLTNSSKALAATIDCVQRYAYSATTTNPFLRRPIPVPSRTSPPSPYPRGRGEFRAEATIFAANVLSGSGIAGFRILPREEIGPQSEQFDAVWVADGGLLGMVQIFAPRKAATVEQVVGVLMAVDSQGCKGAFSSGRYPTQDGAGIGRLMTVCSGSNVPEVQYTVVPRRAGGFYVLGVTATGAGENINEAGTKLYEVVLKSLNRR